jgi:hypothetical protein
LFNCTLMVLITGVFLYFKLGYFFHFCIVFMFGDLDLKWSSCLSFLYMYFLPHSHGMLYVQFFDSCIPFFSLMFVSMLCSVVHDLTHIHTLMAVWLHTLQRHLEIYRETISRSHTNYMMPTSHNKSEHSLSHHPHNMTVCSLQFLFHPRP